MERLRINSPKKTDFREPPKTKEQREQIRESRLSKSRQKYGQRLCPTRTLKNTQEGCFKHKILETAHDSRISMMQSE